MARRRRRRLRLKKSVRIDLENIRICEMVRDDMAVWDALMNGTVGISNMTDHELLETWKTAFGGYPDLDDNSTTRIRRKQVVKEEPICPKVYNGAINGHDGASLGHRAACA